MQRTKIYPAAAASIALVGTMAFTTGGSAATASAIPGRDGTVRTEGQLNPLNNSGGAGHAVVKVTRRHVDVTVDARRVLKKAPHAMHIHFRKDARHECPTVARDDDNNDVQLTTTEGAPAYGPIKASLTQRGDTSPKSALAVDRFPKAREGMINYDREFKVGKRLAKGIRHGNAVIVIHGVDYNGNGKYDFRSEGKSELDPNLPAEATDPALCGVLHN